MTPHPVVPDPHVVPDPDMVRDPHMVRDPKKCAFEISFRCVTFTLGFIFLDILLWCVTPKLRFIARSAVYARVPAPTYGVGA